MSVQIIEKDGRPEWAVLPYEEYQRLMEVVEDRADAAALDEAARRLANGEGERLPAEFVERLIEEDPYKVWREYRGKTLEAVAEAAGISKAYLSMIEAGKRTASAQVRERLAAALGADPDDFV